MPKERVIIDFEIIWQKINHSLTEDEEILLAKWLEESSEHQHYFNEAKRYYNEGSSFNKNNIATREIWNSFINKKNNGHRREYRRILPLIAASVLLFIVISFFIPSKTDRKNPLVVNRTEPIHPGKGITTLILNDGSVLDLNSSKKLQLTEGGSTINIEASKLQYREDIIVPQEIKYNTINVPRGGEFFLELADGTKVWLNSETKLRYPVQFIGNARKVELTGEAFFQVTRNEKAPFYVESGDQTVKVLGTEFNISSYKEDPFTYTTLVKGSVEVYKNNNPEIKQTLQPNEQSSTENGETKITKRKVDFYQYVAWKEGRFVFDDQKLEDIMKTLSKWYDVEVVFTGKNKDIRFTGNLPRYSDFDDILKKIGKTNEIKYTIENKKITIN